MTTMSRTVRLLTTISGLTVLFASVCATSVPASAQSAALTITLTGQSMIRSDVRATAPSAVPLIQGLLKGDVIFTNLEAAVAERGEATQEGRGFLTPPEALDALAALGFNLLALSGNHAFDLKRPASGTRFANRTAGRSFMPERATTSPKRQRRVSCIRQRERLR